MAPVDVRDRLTTYAEATLRLMAWGHSEAGPKRGEGEDRLGMDPRLGFFMVADGMGNSGNGAHAAKMATDIAYARLATLLGDGSVQRDPHGARDRLKHELPALLNHISEQIFHRSKAETACHGMATTVSLLQVVSGIGVIAHIGDSRIYLIRNGQCYQLTEDHTLVAELLRSGNLDPAAVSQFPHRNVLSRALGKSPAVEVDTVVVDVVPGDRILICTDGLSDHVHANEIVQQLSGQPSDAAMRQLVALARQRGSQDDIAIIAAEVHGAQERPRTLPTQEKAGLLGQIFLCRDLSFQEIVRVLATVQEQRVAQGTVVIREGDVGDVIYLLATGRAQVSRAGIVLSNLEVGDHFGELALIGSGHHTVTVTATQDSTLLTLAKNDLYNLVRSDHGIAIKLLWGFLTKLGETVQDQAAQITQLRSGRS